MAEVTATVLPLETQPPTQQESEDGPSTPLPVKRQAALPPELPPFFLPPPPTPLEDPQFSNVVELAIVMFGAFALGAATASLVAYQISKRSVAC